MTVKEEAEARRPCNIVGALENCEWDLKIMDECIHCRIKIKYDLLPHE